MNQARRRAGLAERVDRQRASRGGGHMWYGQPWGSTWVVLVPESRPRAWTSESWVWTQLASRLWLRLWSG